MESPQGARPRRPAHIARSRATASRAARPRIDLLGLRAPSRAGGRSAAAASVTTRSHSRVFRGRSARELYEDFAVNWRNSSSKSGGTHEFETRLDLFFDRCIEEAATGDPAEVCASYELIFDLLRQIDTFDRDIVFWADEGGAGSSASCGGGCCRRTSTASRRPWSRRSSHEGPKPSSTRSSIVGLGLQW